VTASTTADAHETDVGDVPASRPRSPHRRAGPKRRGGMPASRPGPIRNDDRHGNRLA